MFSIAQLSFPDYLLLFLGIFNFIMSIFILVNDPKNRVNLSFTAFAFSLTAWSILLFLFRNVPIQYASVFMRSIYVSGIGIAVTIWYFVHVFPEKRSFSFYHHFWVVLATVVVVVLLYIPGYIVRDTLMLPNGERTIDLNPVGYYTFVIPFLFFYPGGLILFWRRLKTASELLRRQSQVLFTGILILLVFGGFFNVVLPSPFFHNYHYIHLGPVFTFFVVLAVGYGVARLQLMNMKALVTELFVVALILLLSIELFQVENNLELILRLGVIVAVLIFGSLLVGSVISEVKQREKITELAKSLESANIRLQELDRQKTDFLSIAAHQLRTPLSIINGYIELIKDGGYGKVGKKMRDTLDNMDDSNTRLTKLVDEFLDITRIEQGRTKFTFKETNIATVVTSAVEELRDRGEQKGLKIKWVPPKTPIVPSFDDEKVRHVIFNFIDNAIKYSTKGAIVVNLEQDEVGVSVTVNDNGLGFNKVDEANFFQKFYRGENVKGINVTGTGLGLYVCRKFIETHGGRIWAHSEGLGKGSQFGFWIPTVHKMDATKDDENVAKEPISSATFTA